MQNSGHLSADRWHTHSARTKIVVYLSCSAGRTHFARTNMLEIKRGEGVGYKQFFLWGRLSSFQTIHAPSSTKRHTQPKIQNIFGVGIIVFFVR